MDSPEYRAARLAFAELSGRMVASKKRVQRELGARREFDSLCANERVHTVAINGHLLYIVTSPLIFYGPDKVPRGPCEYLITIDATTACITCENQSGIRHYGDKKGHHPHVFDNGHPCLGDEDGSLHKVRNYFAAGELAHVALYMLSFLEIARGGYDYVPVHAWPEMTKEEVQQCLNRRRSGTS